MSDAPARLVASSSQTVGPFFHFGLAMNPRLGRLVYPDTRGERIRLRVSVRDGAGQPVPDALVEIWQADAEGVYVCADGVTLPSDVATPRFCGFGRLPTDQDGACEFDTIRPGRTADEGGRRQAAHVNVCLFMRGLLRQIYTRVYFAGDPTLADDPALAFVPADRRATLVAEPVPGDPATWTFHIHLQGDRETVFFDL